MTLQVLSTTTVNQYHIDKSTYQPVCYCHIIHSMDILKSVAVVVKASVNIYICDCY